MCHHVFFQNIGEEKQDARFTALTQPVLAVIPPEEGCLTGVAQVTEADP